MIQSRRSKMTSGLAHLIHFELNWDMFKTFLINYGVIINFSKFGGKKYLFMVIRTIRRITVMKLIGMK